MRAALALLLLLARAAGWSQARPFARASRPRSARSAAARADDDVRVVAFKDGLDDKIDALSALFARAGRVLDAAPPGAAGAGAPDADALAALRAYGAAYVEGGLQDPARAFARAQALGAEAVRAERAGLRAAVVALARGAGSVQLGVMAARADGGYAALRERFAREMCANVSSCPLSER